MSGLYFRHICISSGPQCESILLGHIYVGSWTYISRCAGRNLPQASIAAEFSWYKFLFKADLCSWLNHVVHTNVALLAIMDLFTCFRRYPSRLAGITGNVAFMLLYIIWVHIVRYFSGLWVYPLLEVLSLPMRYAMLSGLVALNIICYILGEIANNIVWAPEIKLLKESERVKLN